MAEPPVILPPGYEGNKRAFNYSGSGSTTSDDIQKLLQRGFSLESIKHLAETGKLNYQANVGAKAGPLNGPPALTKRVTPDFLSGSRVGGTATRAGSAAGKGVGGGLGDAFGFKKPGKAVSQNSSTGGGVLQKLLANIKQSGGVIDAYKNAAGQQSPESAPVDDFGGGYQPATFERKDFSEEANRLAQSSYGPMFEALNQGRANSTQQYNTSDGVVKGLYEKLVGDIKTQGQEQAASYDQSSNDAAARAQALQDKIGQNYNAAQSQEGALLTQLGAEQAAPDMIPDDRGFQQGQAATAGAAEQDYYGKAKQGNTDYMTSIGAAENTQGTVERQKLLSQLSSVLGQYDQQQLNLTGQQQQSAQDIGMRLSDQDLQLQQLNAGQQQASYQMGQDQRAAQQAAMDRQYQMGQDRQTQANLDRNYELDVNKYKVDTGMAISKANAEQAGKAIDPNAYPDDYEHLPVLQQLSVQANSLTGGQGQAYVDFATQLGNESAGILDTIDKQGFMKIAAEKAGKSGLSQGAAAAIAGSYWTGVLGRR